MSSAQSEVRFIPIVDVVIPKNRFRTLFTERNLTGLQDSISTGHGLINAITLRPSMELNTGESRLKAISILHDLGLPVLYQGKKVPEGHVPAIIVETDLDEIAFLKAELHENTAREGFTYLEEAAAIAKIATLEQGLINAAKKPLEERKAEAAAKSGLGPLGIPLSQISKEAVKKTAEKVFEGNSGAYYDKQVKDSLVIMNAMEKNPDLATKLQKAPNMSEAQKILKKHAEADQRSNLALAQGKTFSNKVHSVIHGDCLEEMAKLPEASFDVCLTDPIYGIDAHKFADGAGKMGNFEHTYEDTLENFKTVLPKALKQVSRLLKERAHIYLACDIRNYHLLKEMLAASSDPNNPWRIPNAPFIQYKVGGGRVPHPGYTPRRSYELWLYAYRGDKQEYKLINDVIECMSDRSDEASRFGACKPKDLLKTFLSRSCMPGDKVIDFMAGSGSVIPACHELKLRCTAIEIVADQYGRCLERVKELR